MYYGPRPLSPALSSRFLLFPPLFRRFRLHPPSKQHCTRVARRRNGRLCFQPDLLQFRANIERVELQPRENVPRESGGFVCIGDIRLRRGAALRSRFFNPGFQILLTLRGTLLCFVLAVYEPPRIADFV